MGKRAESPIRIWWCPAVRSCELRWKKSGRSLSREVLVPRSRTKTTRTVPDISLAFCLLFCESASTLMLCFQDIGVYHCVLNGFVLVFKVSVCVCVCMYVCVVSLRHLALREGGIITPGTVMVASLFSLAEQRSSYLKK